MAAPKYKESVVRDVLTELLISKGFKRVNANWRRETGNTYQLANIQRSTNGPYFFLNFAIVYKEVDPTFIPHRAFGHLQFRAGDDMVRHPDGKSQFKGDTHHYLDEAEQYSVDQRRRFVNGIMWQEAEKIFSKFENISAARDHASLPHKQRIIPMVHRDLLVYFGFTKAIDPDEY